MAELKLFLSGDVMTGRGIDQILRHPGDPTLYEGWARSAVDYVDLAEERGGPIPRAVDPSYIWGDALAILEESSASFRIINLETAITDDGDPWPGKGIHYRMHPDNAACISVAKVDCCTLANNHVLDWSYRGLEQTVSSVRGAEAMVAGAGLVSFAAEEPAVLGAGEGRRVVVVALGTQSSGIEPSWRALPDRPGVALTVLSSSDVDTVAGRVAGVTRPGDVVVASIHWGHNWGFRVPLSHQMFAHDLIDRAGVHIVHGHSSHHPMGIEVYRGRPILYGCGDLINDYEGISGHEAYRPDLRFLYLVEMETGSGRLVRLELVPMLIHRFQLGMAASEERHWLMETLNREGERLGTSVELSGDSLLVRWR